MKKIILLSIVLMINLTAFSQGEKSGGQLFTFNLGHKNFNNQPNKPHNSAGIEYHIAGKRVGLALRGNVISRGSDLIDRIHLGAGAVVKIYYGDNAPSGFYNGVGIDALLTDGRQLMPRGDFGYNFIYGKFCMALEFIAGYDIGYSYSSTGFQSSYFGGLFLGGELKIGFAF